MSEIMWDGIGPLLPIDDVLREAVDLGWSAVVFPVDDESFNVTLRRNDVKYARVYPTDIRYAGAIATAIRTFLRSNNGDAKTYIRIDISGNRGSGSSTLAAFVGRKLLEAGMDVEYLGYDFLQTRSVQKLIESDFPLDLSNNKHVRIYDRG